MDSIVTADTVTDEEIRGLLGTAEHDASIRAEQTDMNNRGWREIADVVRDALNYNPRNSLRQRDARACCAKIITKKGLQR